MDFAKTISEVIENNLFNEFADFDKKIERRERLIQVFFVILSLLVSYNGDSILHENLIRLYLIFVFFALLYYVALPVSIDKFVNALAISKKENDDGASSLKKNADKIRYLDEQIVQIENVSKNLDEQDTNFKKSLKIVEDQDANIEKTLKSIDEHIANLENPVGKSNVNFEPIKSFDEVRSARFEVGKQIDLLRSVKFETVKRHDWARSARFEVGKQLDWLRSARLEAGKQLDFLQSENIATGARLDKSKVQLNVNRFILFF